MNGNKIAIVTAAGRGIGGAIARELVASGYRVSLMSNGGGAEKLADELEGIGITGSVTNEKDLQSLVNHTMKSFGRIDTVINNTGHPPKGLLLEISDDEWHLGMDMLMLNVIRMARLVTPIMRQNGGGSIVNVSTFSTFEPDADFPVSSCFRAALAGFTKMYADRYGRDGIRMNNMLPGFVDNYEASDQIVSRIPLGRYATVGEIAKTARFLASDEAGYITGQNIRVDGGITKSV